MKYRFILLVIISTLLVSGACSFIKRERPATVPVAKPREIQKIPPSELYYHILVGELYQAERDWQRAQKLGPSEALSQSSYDAYKSGYEIASFPHACHKIIWSFPRMVRVRDEDRDWEIYRAIQDGKMRTLRDLAITGYNPALIEASLQRLERYHLVERCGDVGKAPLPPGGNPPLPGEER
jgi:hypothetical protein